MEPTKVLLGHNAHRNHWDLCGGEIDFNESPQAAACREVYEESVRFYGSDLKSQKRGIYFSFLPQDLTREVKFTKSYNGNTDNHYLYFQEIPYINPKTITDASNKEPRQISGRFNPFKENNDYGWMSWRTFAYHGINVYFNSGAPIPTGILENIKGASRFPNSPCYAFNWSSFRYPQAIIHAIDITNKEIAQQSLFFIKDSDEFRNYLTNYYSQRNNSPVFSPINYPFKSSNKPPIPPNPLVNSNINLNKDSQKDRCLSFWERLNINHDLTDNTITRIIQIKGRQFYYIKHDSPREYSSSLGLDRSIIKNAETQKIADWCILSDALDDNASLAHNYINVLKGP